MTVVPRVDAMIVAVEKGRGTTSVGGYLAEHPRVLTQLGPNVGDERLGFPAFASGASDVPESFRRIFLETFGRKPKRGDTIVDKSVGIFYRPASAEALQCSSPTSVDGAALGLQRRVSWFCS